MLVLALSLHRPLTEVSFGRQERLSAALASHSLLLSMATVQTWPCLRVAFPVLPWFVVDFMSHTTHDGVWVLTFASLDGGSQSVGTFVEYSGQSICNR